jgi:hypothetical protein
MTARSPVARSRSEDAADEFGEVLLVRDGRLDEPAHDVPPQLAGVVCIH